MARQLLDLNAIGTEADLYYQTGGSEAINLRPLGVVLEEIVESVEGTGNTVDPRLPVKQPPKLRPDSETGINNQQA